ncbi:hypothetical protein P153DRAFT_219134 [Dothidotthia symphoricarpi CBS 119687]|uniref:Mediator of RNA polymerase II transcription subunit 1 n=1 Tax=Dothidotthia symphoricarpi CBS 119687 TaxID=1392245 RepID=A0A6A6AFZ3_9PLEO|nr:uncharacterized protein P153DRAFT_219134 [Dothidotthia symphoricarpi CBS 119687]KAF2130486.1 hypothetical protein P153DRAFT_219134 [Dothidotthia symphoricarpi CBS 119687]
MATPTPSSKTPSGHLPAFSSPAPRSVPHTGNLGMMNYDSPAVLNMLHEGGVGMGISMSGLGMSQLGLSASSLGRADEAERTRRLHTILDTLKEKPGRVSEEGLLALSKRVDIVVQPDPDGKAHAYILVIGENAMCEVSFINDEVATIDLQTGLDGEHPELNFGATGSQILVRSLKPLPGQSKINVTLERFAENLEKLLTLDKLSAPQNGGVSCYDAIAGVYTSLRRLFEHEKKMALAVMEANTSYMDHKAEREVMCKKSGRPRLNGGLCLGLSLEYWMDRRHIIRKPRPSQHTSGKGKEQENSDSQPEPSYPEDDDSATNKMYSLTIECESSPSALFTPIRISPSWLSDAIEKPADANDTNASLDTILLNAPSIDWLDPKPTYLEPSTNTDAMHLDSAPGRLPNIRFVAKFNPPLVVPLTVYMQLYQSVGIEPRPEEFRATTFVGLALRPGDVDPGMTSTGGGTHEIRASRTVLVVDKEGGRKNRRLPFAHPKQIVEVLPILRQYACATSLLRAVFCEETYPGTQTQGREETLQLDVNLSYTPPAPRLTLHIPHPLSSSSSPTPGTNPTISSLLASLLLPSSTDTENNKDTTAFHPPLTVTLDIQPNADLLIAEQNILDLPTLQSTAREAGDVDMDKVELAEQKVKRLGRALDVCGDLGVWSEWLRREVGRVD